MSTKRAADFFRQGKTIIGIARSYRDHAVELGNAVPTEPIVFFKPTSSYIREGQSVKLPPGVSEIHHEVELGLVIGLEGSRISESSAMDHIAGYILALDMTNRVAQAASKKGGLPWALAKGFDTSCPVSDFIAKEMISDPHDVHLWLKVNGELRQNGNTKDMIFKIPFLISWISRHFKLSPGDVILTGTPPGVGPVKAGDQIKSGIGDLIEMTFNVTEY